MTSASSVHDSGTQNQCSGTRYSEEGRGKGVQDRGTHVYLWLIHVNVWQNPSPYCSYPPTKINNLIKKKTMLDSRGISGHPCLVHDLRRNAFSFAPLASMMLAMHLSYTAFIMLRYVPATLTFWRVFITNGYWILSKAFTASLEIFIWFYSSICRHGVSHWLLCLYWIILASLNKSLLIMVYHPFNLKLDSVC